MRRSKAGRADRLWVKVKWLNREEVVVVWTGFALHAGTESLRTRR
jgi:hypothetical protein